MVRQIDGKFLASKASNDAEIKCCIEETYGKAEAHAKRRSASYYGSKMVNCHVQNTFFVDAKLKI